MNRIQQPAVSIKNSHQEAGPEEFPLFVHSQFQVVFPGTKRKLGNSHAPARTDRPYLAPIRALGTIFRSPQRILHRARKTVSQAKSVKSKTSPRTSQKLQLRHKQKSVYPRAHVAQFTVAFYRQFGRNRPRCPNDQTRSPSTHLLSAGYRYRRNESEETNEAPAHQPAVLQM